MRGRMMQVGGVRQYLPMKGMFGVMPIIFAQAIMFVPERLLPWFKQRLKQIYQIQCIGRIA